MKHLRKLKTKYYTLQIFDGIILFLATFFIAYFASSFAISSFSQKYEKTSASAASAPEIEKIKVAPNTYEKSKIYLSLIKRVGPEKAQDLLYASGLPFNGNTHLLNHTVGDYLYQKYGPSGIVYCRDYFSSSCYHGIIINALGDKKVDNLKNMMQACRKRGEALFGQCVHGLGHGILAYVGYKNLLEGLTMCDDVGKDIPRFNFYLCHNGVFMENIWGVHEGKPSPDRWVKADDIHYPCDDPRIDSKYLGACWYNQHTIMESYYHDDYEKVGKECYALSDESFKKECFEGMFNAIQASSLGDVDQQFAQCRKMPSDWYVHCLTTQIVVELSHGGSTSSFEICLRIDDKDKRECYKTLTDVLVFYFQPNQQETLCKKVPEKYKGKCQKYS